MNSHPTPEKLLFLPGASGNTAFWRPVAALLRHPAERMHIGWPGFGPTPPNPAIKGIDDLVDSVLSEIDRPSALIAQSMGGIVAMRAALQKPGLVTHLVLTVTSGGIDVGRFGGADWRPAFRAANPLVPPWFMDHTQDLSAQLGALELPVLLLWGDADPISPVAVGEELARLLPNAELHVLAGGTHDLAHLFPAQVAALTDEHLASAAWQYLDRQSKQAS